MARFLVALLLAGCAPDGDFIRKPHLEYVTVSIVWVKNSEEACGKGKLSCVDRIGTHAGQTVTIYAEKPASFDDIRVTLLGHELLHALGATHR